MKSDLVQKCADVIAKLGYKMAFIESATAGRMCSEFALTTHSGALLRGGMVCYSVFVKEQILNIPHKTIESYTPESQEVTDRLAKNGSKIFNSDITVAVTGLTTSGGSESIDKPVGTMFIAVKIKSHLLRHREVFEGNPEKIIQQAIEKAAQIILKSITK